MNILNEASELEDYIVNLRRGFHQHAELSLQEHGTIGVVKKELEDLGIEYEIIDGGGVIGVIHGNEIGKTLILRADLDALPMKEEDTNLNQKKIVVSQNDNAAHTCGHDAHTAMLLGSAKLLVQNKNKIKGTVLLAFEQAEEIGGGIYALLKRLKEMGADGVWGIHVKSDIPVGKISVDSGPRMAGSLVFNVVIKGKSGHGSRPDLAISPIDCFVDFYNSLKSMRLNLLDPFKTITYSVGSVTSGSASNVIPDTLQFSGTCRYLHLEQGVKAEHEFKRLLEKICDLHHCSFEYIKEPSAKNLFVYNNEDCSSIAADAVVKALGTDALYHYPAWMASESFGFYQKYFPGVFAFLGIQNSEKGTGAEHHNPHFDVDEDSLKLGVAATVQYAFDFLSNEKTINFDAEKEDMKILMSEMGLLINE